MKTALVITCYNRPQYLAKCLASIDKLTTKPDLIVLVDDASTDKETIRLIAEYGTKKNVHVITHKVNGGIKNSLQNGIEYAFNKSYHYVINLDCDAVVKPDFIKRLLEVHAHTDTITTGFNCVSLQNPVVIGDFKSHHYKRFANGINMCFNRKQYSNYIQPNLLKKEGNWDYDTSISCQSDNKLIAVVEPSVVQHIGMQSSMGHNHQEPDRAQDFKFLSLPDVTLFGIDAHDPQGLERAAAISQRDIEFGAVNIITERRFYGREGYSEFIMKKLAAEFNTSHCLIIHPDGYVINWEAWDNSWLQYDYIGATWMYKDNMNVGNGGFSLRSKKLHDILAKVDIPKQYIHPEDHHICRTYRQSLEDNYGIKFAPEEVANKFSIEAYGCSVMPSANAYSGQFGFHSPHVDFSNSDVPDFIRYKPKQQPVVQPFHRRVANNVRR